MKDKLELVCSECGLHEFDAFNVREAGNVIKEGWIWIGTDLFINSKCCATTEFPGVEYVVGGDCSEALNCLGE
jgi:hypothetical protein